MSEIKETPQPQESKADLDRAKIEESMKGLRQQQDNELQEDLEKFNNRPKPSYSEASTKPETSPTPEIKQENPGSKDLGFNNIQASMQGLREQQAVELQEDLDKFNNRVKPAYYDAQPEPELKPNVTSMSSEMKDEIIRIQSLPLDERQEAVAAYQSSLQDRLGNTTGVGKDLQNRTRIERNGDGVTFLDADGNEYTVWYKDQ